MRKHANDAVCALTYRANLAAEADRNRQSRQVLAEELIVPRLTPDARVLDYGCGPGYLAAGS
jgi:ubiquinone/menaquinone biosynthesis C-methylase UbiE